PATPAPLLCAALRHLSLDPVPDDAGRIAPLLTHDRLEVAEEAAAVAIRLNPEEFLPAVVRGVLGRKEKSEAPRMGRPDPARAIASSLIDASARLKRTLWSEVPLDGHAAEQLLSRCNEVEDL